MIGFVYLWLDSGRNSKSAFGKRRWCLGSHCGTEIDGYTTRTGAGHFHAAYRKRPQDFRRRIIERIYEGNGRDVLNAEQRWLDLIKAEELRHGEISRYYNIKKSAFGLTREDVLSFHEADPTIKQRMSKTHLDRYAADPTLGPKHGQKMKYILADPTIKKKMSDAQLAARVADPSLDQRIGQAIRDAHTADPTISERMSKSQLASYAADPTLGLRKTKVFRDIWNSMTPKQRKEIYDKSWDTRRANGNGWDQRTPEQMKARSDKIWATRRANVAAKLAADVTKVTEPIYPEPGLG